MVIVDEISFASPKDILNLHEKLHQLKQVSGTEKYGGLHVIFTGDFSQLELVNGIPLYRQPDFVPWHAWVNCYIELTDQHHFKEDLVFGNVMKHIREGRPTLADIAYLNTCIVDDNHPTAPRLNDLPHDMAYAVYQNTDRVAINNGIFAEHINNTHSSNKLIPPPEHTLIIRSNDMTWKSNGQPFGESA